MSQRPFSLDPLFRALGVLPGVGPKNAPLIEKLIGGGKVLDLLWHRPIDLIDRRFSPFVRNIPNEHIVTLTVEVVKHSPNARRSQPYRVHCRDDTGTLDLVFFHARKDWLEKQLPIGEMRIISGRAEYYNGKAQIVHPDAIGLEDEREAIQTVEPVYPLTAGVTNKTIRKALTAAHNMIPDLPEWLDESLKKREGWIDWREAMTTLHHPSDSVCLLPDDKNRQRLAYDELLSHQLTLALVRQKQKKQPGRVFNGNGALRRKVLDALPFTLTGAQNRSLEEIYSDMVAPSRMLRLLQGDVGSGKTIVACMAMLNAVECGAQAALMAPTEILARQHAESLKSLFDAAGVRFVILTGRDKGKGRETLLQQIRNGAAQIVIGTHAIFQDAVAFHDLGLAVIDEQHRFGVQQRMELSNKGKGTDVLVMTATPIPRTLTLGAYGDMDVSRLDEKPPGRKPIDTRLLPLDKIDDMIDGLRRMIKDSARVYWVCPLVEESELLDLAFAEERYDVLKHMMGDRVGLVHGKMKPADKDMVMEKFAGGALDVLVATTVIEVGVNVPEATIMVIEHAERFGLSQLHQLRGRVGRGGDKSFCFLLYSGPLGETAKERLKIMRDTEDGFVIAEKDLELRGAGDVLGVKQSGLPKFKLADIEAHSDLLAMAYNDARLVLSKDPNLQTERGQALRTLLYLFERDQAIGYIRSG